jgi:lysophospholipase L1-like esterase
VVLLEVFPGLFQQPAHPIFSHHRIMKFLTSFSALLLFVLPAFADDSMPVFHKDDVILFQGDSITDGGRQREGNDYNHIMGQDYGYIIAGQIGLQFPDRNLLFINRGISGNTVTALAARWQSDTLNLKPNFLSIIVGINDTLFGESVDDYEKTYDKLLSDTIAALPSVKIVLGEPFLLPVGNYKNNYSSHLSDVKKRQDVVANLADKYHLPIIHFQKAFDDACQLAPADHWSWDGVHPTYAGHALMAREWLLTVNQFWPNG